MVNLKIAPTAAHDVSELTLKQAPARLLTFLTGAVRPSIKEKLAPFNWDARSRDGWALLTELRIGNVVTPSASAAPALLAIAACESWQSNELVRARAMLQLTCPEQDAFLFHDYTAGKGMAAVLNVAMFLLRREQLAHGAERKATRKADAEALSLIAETGTTKETLKELQGWVDDAQAATAGESIESIEAVVAAAQLEVLRKIHAWLITWSDMARTVVKRRDHLIVLGLAKRRAKKEPAVVVPPVVTPPVVTAPAVTPPPASTDDGDGPESRAA